MQRPWLFLGIGVSLLTAPLAAQERPSEDELFGGVSSPQAPEAVKPAASREETPGQPTMPGEGEADVGNQAASGDSLHGRDEKAIFGVEAQGTSASSDASPDDPLDIGGLLYSRMSMIAQEETDPADWRLSAPTLIDVYLDAEPNKRVRGLVMGRLTYDPTASDPIGFLVNQAWFKFDIGHRVFVTAGKQNIKWGASRFWNPTDYLQPARLNPLEPLDTRTGVSMVKVHVPWEARGANFYAIALTDGFDSAPGVGEIGLAARGEVAVNRLEVGLDGVLRKGLSPKLGLDISAGVGPIDVHGELALEGGVDTPLWREVDGDDGASYEEYTPEGPVVRASVGADWSGVYNDRDTVAIGVEYFYNGIGYEDAAIYPWLLYNRAYTPFYLGRHYAAVYAALPGPGSWDDVSFGLSAVGNLTDLSVVTRLTVTASVLTHLRLEGYVSHYGGTRGGEFRLQVETDAMVVNGIPIPATSIPAPMFDVGLGLRLAI